MIQTTKMLHNLTFVRDTANDLDSTDQLSKREDVQTDGLRNVRPSRTEKANDRYMPFAVVLPLDAARREAQSIINRPAESGYVSVVQDWIQLADGSIQFTVNWIKADR